MMMMMMMMMMMVMVMMMMMMMIALTMIMVHQGLRDASNGRAPVLPVTPSSPTLSAKAGHQPTLTYWAGPGRTLVSAKT